MIRGRGTHWELVPGVPLARPPPLVPLGTERMREIERVTETLSSSWNMSIPRWGREGRECEREGDESRTFFSFSQERMGGAIRTCHEVKGGG